MAKHVEMPSMAEEIYFESDGTIYKHIGRNQIDSETVALTEIVKNSYDADATQVSIYFDNADKPAGEIIVTDNGLGMSAKEFKEYWMRPGTTHKESEPRSLIFRRAILGRKGMGRFGTDKIAELVVVKSKTKDDLWGFAAKVDGNKFDEPGAKFEKVPVGFRQLPRENLKFVLEDFPSGTEIRLKNLRTKWTKGMIEEIREELSNMISPDGMSASFSITIEVKGDPELSGRLENSLASGYSQELMVRVDKNDTYAIAINGKVTKTGNVIDDCEDLLTSTLEESVSSEIAPTRLASFGSLSSRILYFQGGGLIKRATGKHGKRVDHSGVKVYRSGFRVLPYGERTDDWLRVKAKRSARGGKYYLSPEKITGVIAIDADCNPELEDTTNRQSLLANDEFKTFRFFFAEIVVEGFNKFLETEQTTTKELIRKKRHQSVSRQVAEILSKLKSDPVRKVVADNTKRRIAEAKRLVMVSVPDQNGEQGKRKTREKRGKVVPTTPSGLEREPYIKHKRILVPTDRFVVRPVDAWIEGTKWIVRDEYSPNEELEAWVNELEQEIVYNTGHSMFIAAELSDKQVGQNLETGCGIAVQIHIHKSVAVAWALYHQDKPGETFQSRYKEYEDLASNMIRESSKFVEEVPDEELGETLSEELAEV
jgi:hypothetical protein